MKKIIIILAMVLAGVAMYAQEPQVLVLKDGTVIKGEVEKLPDGGARVTNEYGDIFEYTAEEVSYAGEELSEKQMKKHRKAVNVRDYAAREKGYKLFIETGVGVGSQYIEQMVYWTDPYNGSSHNTWDYGEHTVPSLMLNVINGYSFSQYLYVGGGVGLHMSGLKAAYIPVFAHLRSSFLKKRVSPFVSASGGYGIYCFGAANSYAYSYFYFDGGLGVSIKKKTKGEVWLSLNGTIILYEYKGLTLKVAYSF